MYDITPYRPGTIGTINGVFAVFARVVDGMPLMRPRPPAGTAPERILQLPLDPRSDLFSVGVVIYEMATGRLPFGGASPSETVTNILEKDPLPLTRLAPDRPRDLERVVDRLLAKSADDRFQSAQELRDALVRASKPRRPWERWLRR